MSGYTALKGVKILSLTQFLLGPSGVQYLSDLGAEVIKIEPIQGAYERHWSGGNLYINGQSMFYMLANRNAKSVCLNLKSEEGKSIALKLAENVDVVVQNFRPGVADRLGLGYDSVRTVNPDVIYASASGYGEQGQYRNLPGQDLLLQAMTGLADITGNTDGPPTAAGVAIVDQHGASLLAMGVLAALMNRERTGKGEHVQVTMARAALDLQLESISYHANGYKVERSGNGLASGYHQAPYGVYETADGYLAISLSPISDVARATGSAELERFEGERDPWDRKREIAAVLSKILLRRSTDEWIDSLRANGVWAQKVNSYDETLVDPAIASLNPFETISHDKVGKVTFLRFPVQFSDQNSETKRFPARPGEHTREVLLSLGYTEVDIGSLKADGVVYLDEPETTAHQ